MVVYRATPADVASGVRVGDVEYPGFPAAGAGVAGRRPVAQGRVLRAAARSGLNTPIVAFARDEAGNEATATLRRQRVPEAVQEEPDRARRRVHQPRRARNPRALARAEAGAAGRRRRDAAGVPPDQRRAAPDERRADRGARGEDLAANGCGSGPFVQLGNSQVEAGFADHRTYLYKGKEVDQQVAPRLRPRGHRARADRGRERRHGAATRAGSASTATASSSTTAWASQSLYGHLSSFDVKVGDTRHQAARRSDGAA